jgi:hypothetical protein
LQSSFEGVEGLASFLHKMMLADPSARPTAGEVSKSPVFTTARVGGLKQWLQFQVRLRIGFTNA